MGRYAIGMKRWSLLLLSLVVLPVAYADEPDTTVYVRVPFSALGRALSNLGWGHAYVFSETPGFRARGEESLWFAARPGGPVSGAMAWEDGGRWNHVRFTIADPSAYATDKAAYDKARAEYYGDLLGARVPGAALFRARRSSILGAEAGAEPNVRRWQRPRRGSSYDLFTGGRAFTENLQLDRNLPAAAAAEATIALETIKGITVKPYEWKLPTSPIAVDRLAAFVPEDQYAVFFASPEALRETLALLQDQGTPLLSWIEPRAEDHRVLERYERQLALDLAALPGKTVAVTGSDPYFEGGTDIALILEGVACKDLPQPAGVRAVRGKAAGLAWHGFVSGQRVVSSFRADVNGDAVVSNSRAQLERILAVAQKASPSLAVLDEYRFFRHRYPLGKDAAFLMVPDAAIRKWCSPKWRIATARRQVALSELLDRQVRRADGAKGAPVQAKTIDLALRLDGEQVVSDVYGTADFLTPIAELALDKVTAEEARLYERWRNGYESNWSGFFDPIAARLATGDDGVDFDVSVMPLIDNSDYREFIEVARGVKIGADAGDRHPESLLHVTFAIDADSKPVKRAWRFVAGMTGLEINPMAWLGTSWSVHVDADPFFDEMARADDPEDFFEKNWHRFPGALQCEVRNAGKLALFLIGMRRWIEQTVPDWTTWSIHEHAGKKYTTIRVKGPADWNLDKLRIHYAVAENGLTVTINENMMKRALDRAVRLGKEQTDGDVSPARSNMVAQPWLGEHLGLHGKRALVELFDRVVGSQSFSAQMRRHCYRNLYILNEWKRLYPNDDPVAVHQKVFGTRLLCPGGGKYVWNEKAHTMESTVFGHPAAAKKAKLNPAYMKWAALNAGATFEADGLRARLRLARAR